MNKAIIAILMGLGSVGLTACDTEEDPIEDAADEVEDAADEAEDEVDDATD